jgi:hypothetical protein
MLHKIADELKRFDASIDVIDRDQAKRVIEAALGVVRRLLGAMTVEVFYMSEKPEEQREDDSLVIRTIPYFLRFAEDLDPDDQDALNKTERGDYNPQADGPWTWSYRQNQVVWIEDRNDTTVSSSRDGRPDMDNKAVKGSIVPRKHNVFWTSVKSVITIPFSYNLGTTFADSNSRTNTKGLISDNANGFISFEFKSPKRYNEEQHVQLVRMREAVADLIWKSHAWQDSCDGTNHAVTKFNDECLRARESLLPIKTGLFAPERQGYERLMAPIRTTFIDSKIRMNTYDGVSDALGLLQASQDITQSIRNVHFAVFDITEKNLVVDMLVGVMFAECKPCLILHENSEVARHPLMKRLAERTGQDTDRLYLWFYERQPNGEGYLFFKSSQEERRPWEGVWQEFLRIVRENSPTFHIADDLTR